MLLPARAGHTGRALPRSRACNSTRRCRLLGRGWERDWIASKSSSTSSARPRWARCSASSEALCRRTLPAATNDRSRSARFANPVGDHHERRAEVTHPLCDAQRLIGKAGRLLATAECTVLVDHERLHAATDPIARSPAETSQRPASQPVLPRRACNLGGGRKDCPQLPRPSPAPRHARPARLQVTVALGDITPVWMPIRISTA